MGDGKAFALKGPANCGKTFILDPSGVTLKEFKWSPILLPWISLHVSSDFIVVENNEKILTELKETLGFHGKMLIGKRQRDLMPL